MELYRRSDSGSLTFEDDGAQLFSGAVGECLEALQKCLAHLPADQAGVRISGLEGLRPFLAHNGAIGSVAARILGLESRAVRAILFDKTSGMNWSLAWHQDRTICVKERRNIDDFGPWSTKSGMEHVEPPFELLARMATLRVHLDAVSVNNAPLLISPGSHRRGKVPISNINTIVSRYGQYICLAKAGDVWAYSTPILHASEAASVPARRRVLQIDFAAEELPSGLEWLGV